MGGGGGQGPCFISFQCKDPLLRVNGQRSAQILRIISRVLCLAVLCRGHWSVWNPRNRAQRCTAVVTDQGRRAGPLLYSLAACSRTASFWGVLCITGHANRMPLRWQAYHRPGTLHGGSSK